MYSTLLLLFLLFKYYSLENISFFKKENNDHGEKGGAELGRKLRTPTQDDDGHVPPRER